MKSHIKLVSTKDMNKDEWLAYRMKGIGASEIGTLLGINGSYASPMSLFDVKIGESPAFNVQTIAAFLGINQEEFISTMWEAWGGDQESMMINFSAGVKIRKCRRVNAYAHNDKYPWLFASLDFEINQHNGKGNGTLETKTIGGYNADKWISGIPPAYIVQLQTQMLVCEYEYGEIAILKDNRDFSVIPFEFNQSICDGIIERSYQFWENVKKARSLITQRYEATTNYNYQKAEQINADLQNLYPPVDGSDATNEYLKEKYQIALPGERFGTLEELEEAKKHKAIKKQIEGLEEEKQLHENILKRSIADGCDKLDFGKEGYISWKANKNGSRMFLNKLK